MRIADRGRIKAASLRVVGSTALLGAVVGLVTWFPYPLTPGAGLDTSWRTALQMGTARGLDFGTELVFTYGPLGFLENPQIAFDSTAIAAAIYTIGGRVALGIALLWVTRERFGLVTGLVLSIALGLVLPNVLLPLALTSLLAIASVTEQPPRVPARLVILGGPVLAAIAVLLKLNLGVTVLPIVAMAAIALPANRVRNAVLATAMFVLTGTILWLATGQGLDGIPGYVRTSLETIAGYSTAMPSDSYSLVEWDLAVGLTAIAGLLAATGWTTRGLPAIRRIAAVAIVAILCFALFKQGFVRPGPEQATVFFAGIAVPWVALPWRGKLIPLGALASLALVVAWVPASGRDIGDLDPIARARAGFDQIRTMLDPERREDARVGARLWLSSEYRVDPSTLALLEGHTVDVQPWEASIAWAYGLDWRPLPVFQSYAAYTAALDRENAEALLAADGPERILRHLGIGGDGSIDGRYGPFDEPMTTLAELCDYRALRTTRRYQVLGRSKDRCRPERPLGEVRTGLAQNVEVPAARPGEAIVVRIEGTEPSPLEAIERLLYRARLWLIVVDGQSYRLIPASGRSGLLLSVPPGLDFPAPFELAPDASTLAFYSESDPGAELRLRFSAIPVGRRGGA